LQGPLPFLSFQIGRGWGSLSPSVLFSPFLLPSLALPKRWHAIVGLIVVAVFPFFLRPRFGTPFLLIPAFTSPE